MFSFKSKQKRIRFLITALMYNENMSYENVKYKRKRASEIAKKLNEVLPNPDTELKY